MSVLAVYEAFQLRIEWHKTWFVWLMGLEDHASELLMTSQRWLSKIVAPKFLGFFALHKLWLYLVSNEITIGVGLPTLHSCRPVLVGQLSLRSWWMEGCDLAKHFTQVVDFNHVLECLVEWWCTSSTCNVDSLLGTLLTWCFKDQQRGLSSHFRLLGPLVVF